MGLGKTIAALTAIDGLMYHRFEIDRVLVIAPKFVALNVWTAEIAKWPHVRHLTTSVITGTPNRRVMALKAKADIYIINRENVEWLVKHYGSKWPYDMVVIDELSSFKSPSARRFRALRTVRPKIRRIVGLTGTPAPNGVGDLWSQLFLLDQGARLGTTLTGFREAYMAPDKRDAFRVFNWKPRNGSEKVIYDRISDICVSMKATDYLQLPARMEHEMVIDLDAPVQAQYDAFKREQVMAMAGTEITALNAAALVTKLLQFSNGAVYDGGRNVHHIHDTKLEALGEIIEQAGAPVLIFYNYIHDRARIMAKFDARELKTTADIDDWNAGKIPVMVAHPASAGHGLNLQMGGNIIVWFGLTWNLELYQQANARLDRQGQRKPVIIYKLVCKNTIDTVVLKLLDKKQGGQNALMDAVKAIINGQV